MARGAAAAGASIALAKLVGKNIRQLDGEMKMLAKHMKLLKDFAANPAVHQRAMQKMSVDAAGRVKRAQVQSDKLWLAVRKATEKLPKDQRKSIRKDLEKALSKVDTQIEAAGKAAGGLYRKLEKIQKDKIIDSPADGALQTVLVTVQALHTAWKGWKKMRDKSMK